MIIWQAYIYSYEYVKWIYMVKFTWPTWLIYNIKTGYRLEYNSSDGIIGDRIHQAECDDHWVWFSTNAGISFYNWEQYHYEK